MVSEVIIYLYINLTKYEDQHLYAETINGDEKNQRFK